jgi:DNA replication protein DnaC
MIQERKALKMLPSGDTAQPRCERCGASAPIVILDLPWEKIRLPARCGCEAAAHEKKAGRNRFIERQALLDRMANRDVIGEEFKSASFKSFNVTDHNRPVYEACLRYARSLDEKMQDGASLGLMGCVGTGKTHLLVAIHKAAVRRGLTSAVVKTPLLFERLRPRAGDSDTARAEIEQLIERLFTVDLLALDDINLGFRDNASPWREEKLYLIVDHRTAHRRPVNFSANTTSWEELSRSLGGRIVDRLRRKRAKDGPGMKPGGCLAFCMKWESYR